MYQQIQQIAKQIQQKFSPDKIILFGSYADGTPTADSDIDLLVIMDYKGSAKNQAVRILSNISYHFPLDLIVRSEKQVVQRIKDGDFFLKDIIEKGVVVHDKTIS